MYNFLSTIQLEQLPKSVFDAVELKALFGQGYSFACFAFKEK